MQVTPELIGAMRGIVDKYHPSLGPCNACGCVSGGHMNGCYVEVFRAFLAAHDGPKGETETVTIAIVQSSVGCDVATVVEQHVAGDPWKEAVSTARERLEDFSGVEDLRTYQAVLEVPKWKPAKPETIEGHVFE